MASWTRNPRIMILLVLVQIIIMISNVPKCNGLTYDELVYGFEDKVTQRRQNPVIPKDVRDDGNVTVTERSDGTVSVTFKGLPNHDTMMVNPNEAEVRDFMVNFPEDPQLQDKETCLDGGPVGWTIHGVALYNPFNAEGTNAVEGEDAETFDSCQGHPDMSGTYHYHQLPDACVFPGINKNIHGIALDGFPIYGPNKEDGTLVKESDLDKCHGRCGADGQYRYHMTKTFPYIIGCYRGTPTTFTSIGGDFGPPGGGIPPTGEDGGRPPRPSGGPPPSGDDGDRSPPPARRRRQADSPNQCAYNTVVGDMYEFQTCVKPLGDGSGPLKPTFALVCITGILAWVH